MSFPADKLGKFISLTPFAAKCLTYQKGCSFVTNLMKKEQIGRHNWDSALAWHTWKRDQHIDISKEDWGKALNLVHKSKVPNRPKWHSLTIFLRTVWTNKKKYLSTHNEGDKYCNLCVTEIQDTFHLYYNCKITKRLFTNVSLMVKDLCNLNLPIHPNSFLFHNFDDVKRKRGQQK